MKFFASLLVAAGFMVAATYPATATAATGFLKGDRTDGLSKVCYYDVLGESYELNVRATDICPLNHEFQVAPRPPQQNYTAEQGGKTGFLKGHQTQGMSQVCYYDVLGEVREVTISSAAICPLNMKFP